MFFIRPKRGMTMATNSGTYCSKRVEQILTSLSRRYAIGSAGAVMISLFSLAASTAFAEAASARTFSSINHNVQSGDGLATIITNILVTIDKSSNYDVVAYSLDYDFYNQTEGDKSSSSDTALIVDFLGANGQPLPVPSIVSKQWRQHCTFGGSAHRHETGLLNLPYFHFVQQVSSIRVRDSGVQGYQGVCSG